MQDRKFLIIFISTVTLLLFGMTSFIEVVNPELTGKLNLRFYESWTTNVEYIKFKKIEEAKDIETVILGSSTSEAFHTSDIDKLYNTKSYSISLGGADTPTRSVFFKHSVKKLKNLKRIIYVADFFEFNKKGVKSSVSFNREMDHELSSFAKPGFFEFIKYYLNHQLLESAFNVLIRKKKNKRIIIGENGGNSRSMVLSPIQAKNGNEALLNTDEKNALMEFIIENYMSYSKGALNNFDELDPLIVSLYDEMIEVSKEAGVEIIFVLSPYHYEFRQKLMTIENLPKVYKSWQKKLEGYAISQNVRTINATDSFIANEPMSGAWRDGIHYSRGAAFTILKDSLD